MYTSSNVFKRIFTNPALGLIPYLVFSILIGQVNTFAAFAVGFGLSILPLLLRMHSEIRVLYDISAWSFLISAIWLSFLVPDLHPQFSFILAEIVFVFSLMIFRLSRKTMIRRLHKRREAERKYYLYETFQVIFQAQYALTFHLLVVLGFRVFFILRFPMLDIMLVLIIFHIIFRCFCVWNSCF